MQGLLRADVSTTTADVWVQHNLDVIAPVLHHYRVRLLTARHQKGQVYPVTVQAECFHPESASPSAAEPCFLVEGGRARADGREAATQDEFIVLVRQALHSCQVRALIQSLIASSNEARTSEHEPGGGASRNEG